MKRFPFPCVFCNLNGDYRRGYQFDGRPYGLCREHHAQEIERTAKQPLPNLLPIVTSPNTAEEFLIQHGQRLALTAAAEADMIRPAGSTLQ